jgi:putative ABC transport system permease protein
VTERGRARASGSPGRRFGGDFPTTTLAWTALSRNRVRTLLATAGIVIGVFAVASLGILGSVLELTATASLGDLGNQVVITPNADVGAESLTDRQVAAIRRAAGDATVVPVIAGGALATAGDRQSFVTVYGVDRPGDLFVAAAGDLPDRHRRGAIVGADVAAQLDVGVGRTITLEGREFRIVAVLAASEGVELVSGGNAVVLPEAAFADRAYTQVIVRAESGAQAAAVARDVEAALNTRTEVVEVLELSSIVDQIDEFFGLLSAFLLAIGAISLTVAGVSILNVMLMSVRERRQEIGVLRAVGVQRGQVVRLILLEAGLLGAVGGLGGVALAVVGTALLWAAIPEVTLAAVLAPVNGRHLLVAFGFGLAVSLLSGVYPAREAAARRPVEALRDA